MGQIVSEPWNAQSTWAQQSQQVIWKRRGIQLILFQVMLNTEMSLFCAVLHHENHLTSHLVTYWCIQKPSKTFYLPFKQSISRVDQVPCSSNRKISITLTIWGTMLTSQLSLQRCSAGEAEGEAYLQDTGILMHPFTSSPPVPPLLLLLVQQAGAVK